MKTSSIYTDLSRILKAAFTDAPIPALNKSLQVPYRRLLQARDLTVTSILYLLGPQDKSCLHRIRQDEIWHFYLGGPLRLVIIDAKGELNEIKMGPDVLHGQQVQSLAPKGCWFGAKPLPETA